MSQIAMFAGAFGALYAAHMFGDHWVQTHKQACGKGARTPMGQTLCLQHVISLTITKAGFVLLLELVTDVRFGILPFLIGIAVDAISHYWADRRYTLEALAGRLGKLDFYRLGSPRPDRDDNPSIGTGAYALDQSWHVLWLFIAALIMSV